MRPLRVIIFTGLIVAGALIALWLLNLRHDEASGERPETSGLPDNSMRNIELITTDETGTPQYRLRAEYMIHFPQDDSTTLESPNMLYYRDTKPPVTIRSDKARITSQGKEIFLQGDVDISHSGNATDSRFNMKTTELYVYPDTSVARNDVFFSGYKANLYFEGVGMESHFLTDTFYILSEARGIHVP